MPAETHLFDLAGMRLAVGEGRRLDLSVPLLPLRLGRELYRPEPELTDVRLDVSRMVGNGYALRLRFATRLVGPCMRCLAEARRSLEVDAREVELPDAGEELSSPYVRGELLDLAAWAQEAFALAAPVQVLCAPDCPGLCPICAIDLNEAGPEHHHEREPDARWAKLGELDLQ